MSGLWRVSVTQGSRNARITVKAETTAEVFDLIKKEYPGGFIAGIWPADDLAKAEPHHFSIGLMRDRVKDLRAAPKGEDS